MDANCKDFYGKTGNFTKQHTQIAKGVAIILMVIHHLFGLEKNIDYVSSFLPQIGSFGKVCVAMYAFMSGYGLYLSYKSKGTIHPVKRIFGLYIRYWISLIIIVAFTAVFSIDELKIGALKLFLNFFAVYFTLDPNVWFLLPYIVFIFALPIICFLISKIKRKIMQFFAEIFALFLIPITISFLLDSIDFSNKSGVTAYFIGVSLRFIVLLIPFFSVGYIFEFISKFKCNRIVLFIALVLAIVLCYICRLHFNLYVSMGMSFTDLIIAPVMVFATSNLIVSMNLKPITYVFEKLGFLSCNIWFVHALFCQGALMWITYLPKYDWLIALFGAALSIIAAIIVELIYTTFIKIISRLCNNEKFKMNKGKV